MNNTSSGLAEHLHQQLVVGLVAREITCSITGRVLDARTCAVLVDADGDPRGVYDPSVPGTMTESKRAQLARLGFHFAGQEG